MTSIFEFNNYYDYLSGWIGSQPNKGRGVKGSFAKALGVSSTLVSFILSGKKPLSLEHASDLADFIGLNETESDFFFLLVERERAGHVRLKAKFDRKIEVARVQSKKISKRVKKDAELSDELKAIYYSSWIYTAIRNLVALEKFKDTASISRRLNIPLSTTTKVLQFLLENQLCVERDGIILSGPTYTHVDADSPYVNKHRQNWRLRGFSIMEQKSESDIFYTSPMSISYADADKIRDMILNYIQEILAVMRPSPSEKVCCLNIDWFEY